MLLSPVCGREGKINATQNRNLKQHASRAMAFEIELAPLPNPLPASGERGANCSLSREREITSDLAGVVCQPSRVAKKFIRIGERKAAKIRMPHS